MDAAIRIPNVRYEIETEAGRLDGRNEKHLRSAVLGPAAGSIQIPNVTNPLRYALFKRSLRGLWYDLRRS